MDYNCNICDKSINDKPRNKHNKTKRHVFMKIYVTKIYNYNDIGSDDVAKILHENIISHNNKINKFKIYVSCKINDDIEIEVYKNEGDLDVVVNLFLGEDTLFVDVAGKMICNNIRENLTSRYKTNCTHNMYIKNLSIKFISRYDNMKYRYQLEQPRPMIESKTVRHIKYMSEEEKINKYNFFTCKHNLSLL